GAAAHVPSARAGFAHPGLGGRIGKAAASLINDANDRTAVTPNCDVAAIQTRLCDRSAPGKVQCALAAIAPNGEPIARIYHRRATDIIGANREYVIRGNLILA